MLKKIFFYSLAAVAIGTGCTKDEQLKGSENVIAYASLTNVNASAKSVDFFIDGVKKTANGALAPNSTVLGTYVGFNADQHGITIKDATNAAEYVSTTFTGIAGTAYSYFVYDTLVGGKLKTLMVKANRSLPKDNVTTSNVRFLNFSPKSPALDCWFVRLVGAVRTDSVKVGAAMPYIGSVAAPDVEALSAYTNIKASQLAGAIATGSAATTYSIKLTLANTNTIVGTVAATSLVPGRNYTFYARGVYPASAFSVLTDN